MIQRCILMLGMRVKYNVHLFLGLLHHFIVYDISLLILHRALVGAFDLANQCWIHTQKIVSSSPVNTVILLCPLLRHFTIIGIGENVTGLVLPYEVNTHYVHL